MYVREEWLSRTKQKHLSTMMRHAFLRSVRENALNGASLSEPHTYEKNRVPTCMYVCSNTSSTCSSRTQII